MEIGVKIPQPKWFARTERWQFKLKNGKSVRKKRSLFATLFLIQRIPVCLIFIFAEVRPLKPKSLLHIFAYEF